MLREQLDDLEQYTRRTNIRIFGIPEPTSTDREDTDAKAIDFFANQLGITVSSHYTGAPNNRFLGNDLQWLVMHPGVL